MANTTLEIHLNGAPAHIGKGSNLADIIAQHQLDITKVALCVNDAIVPRSQYAQTPLAAGDQVEIVQFIGGG